jgi:protein phosphatase inhibitor 2
LKHDDVDVDVDETMNESSSSSPTTTSGGKKSKSRSNNNKKSSGKDKHLKWDEAKIKEHDELRGTRMKIEEPNTPFAHYDSGSETDGSLSSAKKSGGNKESISWDALTNKLEAHVAVKEAYPSSPSSHDGGGTADEEEGEDRQKELKELEFKEHRKRHYNEMELVRKFRQEHPDGVLVSEEADEDNDDDDNDNDADDENE